MPHRSLPGTLFARLQEIVLLTGALVQRGIAVMGLRALEHAFTHETPDGRRQFRKPILTFVRLGYWMLGGVATNKWDSPAAEATAAQSSPETGRPGIHPRL